MKRSDDSGIEIRRKELFYERRSAVFRRPAAVVCESADLVTDSLTAFLGVAASTHEKGFSEDRVPPNIVFILADDLGWSDTTLYGTTAFYETPHIERLAERGMTFTRAYSASPLCSPTRASILTGLSPARHGITSPTCHLHRLCSLPSQALVHLPDGRLCRSPQSLV